MKKALQILAAVTLAMPALAFAADQKTQTTVDKVQAAQGVATAAEVNLQNKTVTLISPRTGIRYVLGDADNRPIIFKTIVIAPADAASAQRIVASNPALSMQSQEKAKQALVSFVAQPTGN